MVILNFNNIFVIILYLLNFSSVYIKISVPTTLLLLILLVYLLVKFLTFTHKEDDYNQILNKLKTSNDLHSYLAIQYIGKLKPKNKDKCNVE